jgi:subtilisin family serine protease
MRSLSSASPWPRYRARHCADGSYAKQPGDPRVLVGILDTGVDGSHPDIAPNFSNALSWRSRTATSIPTARLTKSFVVRDCQHGTCAYYQWIQGTSMASPHAVGVAALIISQFGHPVGRTGWTMHPKNVQKILERSATDHACPTPPLISYVREGRSTAFDALCEGTPEFNSIWGKGIVDALARSPQGPAATRTAARQRYERRSGAVGFAPPPC